MSSFVIFAANAALACAVRPNTVVVVGGGAAGFFGAITAASSAESHLRVVLLEATPAILGKVRISGGGRCNVCHDDTKDRAVIASGYPRGERTLLGSLSRFGATDATAWFRSRGVELKTEADGRMFPVSDSSETIVRALSDAADEFGVEVQRRAKVVRIQRCDGSDDSGGSHDRFEIVYQAPGASGAREEISLRCRSLLVATGGTRDGHQLLERDLGVPLVAPVPSLFTLDLAPNGITEGLAGISVPDATVRLHWAADEDATRVNDGDGSGQPDGSAGDAPTKNAPTTKKKRKRGGRGGGATKFEASGPCLITHKGLSGPACLRLSAFAARELAAREYRGELRVNWHPSHNEEQVLEACRGFASRSPKRGVVGYSPVGLPRRLWANLAASAGIEADTPWAAVSKAKMRALAQAVTSTTLRFVSKSTNKDEFVTAGGADLKAFSPKTFECKATPGLYLAGEVLNVDGITGGYNFLNAWTTSWTAGSAIAADADALSDSEPRER